MLLTRSFAMLLGAAMLTPVGSCATTSTAGVRDASPLPTADAAQVPPVPPFLGPVALADLPDRNVDLARVEGTPFVFPKTSLFTNLFPPEGGKEMVGFRLKHVSSGTRVDVVLADTPRSRDHFDDVKVAQRLLGATLDERAQRSAVFTVLEKGTACRAPVDGHVYECLAWWPKDHLVFILVHDAPQGDNDRAALLRDLREPLSAYAMIGLQK